MGAATRNRVVVTIETAMRRRVIFVYLLFLYYLLFQLNAYYDSHCHYSGVNFSPDEVARV